MRRRVVITGLGLVTPLGGSVKSSWDKLSQNQSGIRKIDRFDIEDLPCKIAGLVPYVTKDHGDFSPDDYVSPKDQRKLDNFILYGIAAASQAIEDSGWQPQNDEMRERAGVMIGSGIGGLPRIYETSVALYEGGFKKVSPFFITASLINLVSGQVAIKYGLKGPNHATVTACSSGAHAIGDSARLIQRGDVDVMVAGGAEAAVCRIGMAGFSSMRALSTNFNDDPTKASRPWDRDRDGFVMGEGSGVIVLEDYEHAKKRGAKIYAELVGYGMSGDAYHITAPAPDGDGGFRAMRNAIQSAELSTADIGYVNAHGTSTPMGDEIELGAIKRLFGSDIETTAISSTKSAIGHLLGAAGGVEAVFSILALNNNLLPPTLNLENPSSGCENINLVPQQAQEKKFKHALSNSFGFGGTNACLIFSSV